MNLLVKLLAPLCLLLALAGCTQQAPPQAAVRGAVPTNTHPPTDVLVTTLGARPGDSTDDTSAIAAAITKAGVGGRVRFDTPGVYIVSQLDVLDNQTIEIPAGVTVRRKVNHTAGDACLFKIADKTGVRICGGGTIDGNRTGHTNGGAPDYLVSGGRESSGVLISGGSNHKIEDLEFVNMPTTSGGANGSGIVVSTGTGGLTDYADEIEVSRCLFDACTRNALQSGSCRRLKFHHNICRNANHSGNDGASIQLEGEDGNTSALFSDCEIADNDIYDNRLGISISNHSAAQANFSDFKILRNIVRDCTSGNGLYVSKSQYVDIVGNRIIDGADFGMYLIDVVNLKVMQNIVRGNASHGILARGCQFFQFSENHILLNAYNGINVLCINADSSGGLPTYGLIARNEIWNNGVDPTYSDQRNGLIINAFGGEQGTSSKLKVHDNWFGNSSAYGSATQTYGWADKSSGEYCKDGEFTRNSYLANATGTYLTQGVNWIDESQTAANSLVVGGGLVRLTGVRFPSVKVAASVGTGTSVHNDAKEGGSAYTPASGKRAAIVRYSISNQDPNGTNSGAAASVFPEMKTAGSEYHRLLTSISVLQGASQGSTAVAYILEAGEKISLNCDLVDCMAHFTVIEFDATSSLRSEKLTALAVSTNTTLYTCPASKTAFLLDSQLQPSATVLGVLYTNESGGTRAVQCNLIPSGGSASTGNLLFSGNISNNLRWTTTSIASVSTMSAGDFIQCKTNLAADGTNRQIFWVNVVETQ